MEDPRVSKWFPDIKLNKLGLGHLNWKMESGVALANTQ